MQNNITKPESAMTMPACIEPWIFSGLSWGNFAVCCNSYKRDFGDISSFSSDTDFKSEIFNSVNYTEMREKLGRGEVPDVCRLCSKKFHLGTLSVYQSMILEHLFKIEDKQQQFRALQNYNLCVDSIQNNIANVEYMPVFSIINTGSACNLKCKFCYNRQMKYNPEPEKILDVLDSIHETLAYCTLSGGEPFLTKAGRAILEKLAEGRYKFAVQIITNANSIDFELLEHVNLAEIVVSTDGATKRVYETVRPGGDFEMLINNIKKLTSLKKTKPFLRVSTNYTITSDNFADIPKAVELYEKLGVDIVFNPVLREDNDPQNIMFRTDLYVDFIEKLDQGIKATGRQATRNALQHSKKIIKKAMNGTEE